MIQSITILSPFHKEHFVFDSKMEAKIGIDCSKILSKKITSFDIEIVFSVTISEFRNHDYTWVNCNSTRIANEFSPKILKLENGFFVQPNCNKGFWEIDKKKKNVLLWRFNPENAAPLTTYKGNTNRKIITQANQDFDFLKNISLLFSKKNAIEFSRSIIPFSAIVVFTDHCDFDTEENLTLQRIFFKSNGIKTTKGFFLNHFSKRENNASFQNNADEIIKWRSDGHELCYHSLSQSLKSDKVSIDDFLNFTPPFPDSRTWIDHGYQPYNFSLFQNKKIENEDYENNLKNKNIEILWNYIDTGTATSGVINQLNSDQFTLSSFLKGNKNLGLLKKLQLVIKNIIFHYYGNEDLIFKYQSLAGNYKKVVIHKKMGSIFPFLKDLFNLVFVIFSVFIFWNKNKNKSFKLAKYNPIVFKHRIFEKDFYVFQTLEMVDFKKALEEKNIDLLIKEKGVFIAHTYFSVPMTYHIGKMFSTPNAIDKVVVANFKKLGIKIKDKQIWNPTLSELVDYWSNFDDILLNTNELGEIIVKNNVDLIYRNANID